MDITGIQMLEIVITKLRKRGMQVLLCEANARVLSKLYKADVLNENIPVGYTDQLIEAIRTVQPALDSMVPTAS